MPKAKDSPKIDDVTRPGKTAPSPTSRPVIVGHGPMLLDPMVQPNSDTADSPTIAPKAPSAQQSIHQKIIEAPASLTVPNQPDNDKSADQPPSTPPDTSFEPTDQSSQPEADRQAEAVVDTVADQAAARKQQAEFDKQQAAKRAHLQELIDQKTYFVPINAAKRRQGHRRLAIIGMLVVVAAMLAGAAYYLEII